MNIQWKLGVPTQGWIVGYETISVSRLSTQFVVIPLAAAKAGAAYNPTSDTLQFTFMPTATQVPVTADWVSGSWETVTNSPVYPYNAKCLIGPSGVTALTLGNYYMYMKVTDSPEIPVFVAGTLAIS